MNVRPTATDPAPSLPAPITILGVPFDLVTPEETLERIGAMIASGRPHYLATANVDFLVQALEDAELRRILFDAHLVLADGMPVVWASRFLGNPLPCRVTGSDLVPRLLAEAEKRGWRVFLLGGAEDSLRRAADNIRIQYPRLALAGAFSPPFRPLLEMDHEDILRRLHEAKPDLLFVAFGCPKQEKWLKMHYRRAGVPVGIGVGATIDFLAGTFRRAPVWMQRTGLEWVFRLLQEPRRLAGRYGRGLWVFGRAILRQWWRMRSGSPSRMPPPPPAPVEEHPDIQVIAAPPRLDAAAAAEHQVDWEARVVTGSAVFDLSPTEFVDSTGIGMLVRLQQRARELGHRFILASAQDRFLRVLKLMRLEEMFELETSLETARAEVSHPKSPGDSVQVESRTPLTLCWRGEITSANAEEIARETLAHMAEIESGTEVIVNLGAVRFIDSSGVGAMILLKRQLWERQVSVRYANVGATVHNVLALTRVDEYLLGSTS